jgi:hypothetical protein
VRDDRRQAVQVATPTLKHKYSLLICFKNNNYMQGCGYPLANSPNASRIQDWQVKIQTHSPVWRFFFPLLVSYTVYIFGQFFSDLASENTKPLASLVSALENLFTPLLHVIIIWTLVSTTTL